MCSEFLASRANETRGELAVEAGHELAAILRQKDDATHGARRLDGAERAGIEDLGKGLEIAQDAIGPAGELVGTFDAPGFAFARAGDEKERFHGADARQRLERRAHAGGLEHAIAG